MRERLGLDEHTIIGSQFEALLTVGSKIFFQTHFHPLIMMQHSAREIYLSFKGEGGAIPVLLNVEVIGLDQDIEIHCGGMEISNRNRFEKELIEAKKIAEDALIENDELVRVKNELLQNQQAREIQYRQLRSLQEQQQELFKLIAHDLQEPLRKSIFFSNYLLNHSGPLADGFSEKLLRIISFNSDMKQMLLTLQRFEELEHKKLNYSAISISNSVKEAITALDLSNAQQVNITYAINELEFYADPQMLTDLFIELLRHSLKNKKPGNERVAIEISATETQKNVFIESRDKYQYDRYVKITYVDNGFGFTTDSEKIFRIIQKSAQFNQVSMGLAYCKRIVEKHSGNIVAKSVREKGVGYTIFLPITLPNKNLT